ncbi:hypothetical protein CRUP_019137 [Coryphaenoides rupestris]|nr:hypothetical protein CRUP_019137 [Coryphaenoides rupestris]
METLGPLCWAHVGEGRVQPRGLAGVGVVGPGTLVLPVLKLSTGGQRREGGAVGSEEEEEEEGEGEACCCCCCCCCCCLDSQAECPLAAARA